ncbi:MAG: hypothetical protein ACPLRU_01650 [Desulfofundulus sp.]
MLLYEDKNGHFPEEDEGELYSVFVTERLEDYLALSIAAVLVIIILLFF